MSKYRREPGTPSVGVGVVFTIAGLLVAALALLFLFWMVKCFQYRHPILGAICAILMLAAGAFAAALLQFGLSAFKRPKKQEEAPANVHPIRTVNTSVVSPTVSVSMRSGREYTDVRLYKPNTIHVTPEIGDAVEFRLDPENPCDADAIAAWATVDGEDQRTGVDTKAPAPVEEPAISSTGGRPSPETDTSVAAQSARLPMHVLREDRLSKPNNVRVTPQQSKPAEVVPPAPAQGTSRSPYAAECDRIKKREDFYRERAQRAAEFNQLLDSIPATEVIISEQPAKKQAVGELCDVVFSNITKKTPRDKLGNFVAFDVETTGLSVSSAEIVEIAAIRFRSWEPVEKFSTLCRPRKGINEAAAKMNGITLQMVEDKPEFRQIAESFQFFIGKDNLVAHNLEFDLKFIYKNGVDVLAEKRKFYDTLDIAQRTLKKAKEKWDKEIGGYVTNFDAEYDVDDYKLGTLAEYYGIPLYGAHRALADCYATGILLQKLAKDRE